MEVLREIHDGDFGLMKLTLFKGNPMDLEWLGTLPNGVHFCFPVQFPEDEPISREHRLRLLDMIDREAEVRASMIKAWGDRLAERSLEIGRTIPDPAALAKVLKPWRFETRHNSVVLEYEVEAGDEWFDGYVVCVRFEDGHLYITP